MSAQKYPDTGALAMMDTRLLSAAALAIFGVVLTTSAIAEDRAPTAKPEPAAAVFGAGANVIALDDAELAGHSGAGKGTRPDGKDFGGSPNSLVGNVLPPVSGVSPSAPSSQPASQPVAISGFTTLGGAQ